MPAVNADADSPSIARTCSPTAIRVSTVFLGGFCDMDLAIEPAGLAARILAILSLVMGLGDAAHLLGVWSGPQSPLTAFGVTGFALLAILAAARLFAALGLWLQVQWGAVLLAAALVVELGAVLLGNGLVTMTLYSFIFKLAVLLATFALLAMSWFMTRRHAAD